MKQANKDGSVPLRGNQEVFCQRLVNEPWLKEVEIYTEIFPDKKNPYQSVYQYKKSVYIKARIQYLRSKATQDARNTLDDEVGRLKLTTQNLYTQATNAMGQVTDVKIYKLYMETLEMLHKLEGKYTVKSESTVTVETTADKKARIAGLLDD